MDRVVRLTYKLKDKGIMVKESEVANLADPESALYQSLYYYGKDAVEYFKKNKNSIARYKGEVSTPYIVFDIDSKDLEVSKQNTIILIDWLKEQGLYNEFAAKIAFSGSKGFHLTLKTSYEFSPKELKSLCMYISSQVPFVEEAGFQRVDPSIYNTNRQFRVVNTINPKSGLHKIEMVEKELRECTMETITKAAATTQKTYPFEAVIDDKPIRAILLQLKEDKKDKYEKPKDNVIKKFMSTGKLKKCIEAIQSGEMKDGESNAGLLRLASYYRRRGYTEEQCREKLVEASINRKQKYPNTNEITDEKLDYEILSTVYSTEGYIFTCEDWFLKSKCEGNCTYNAEIPSTDLQKPVELFQPPKPTVNPPEVLKPSKSVSDPFSGGFKSGMKVQTKEDIMSLSGFRTVKQSSESFKSFADNWKDHLVITGIKELDDIVRMLPTGLVVVNARPGVGKCLGKGTEVRMFDGTLKKVEDIEVGDLVMAPDSTARKVTSLARGREEMFRVDQKYGISYEVNRSHILSLKHPEKGLVNIEVDELLGKSTRFRTRAKGWKSGFDLPFKTTEIPPYLLGIWLGDGHSSGARVTTMDDEIVSYMESYCSAFGLNLSKQAPCGQAYTYSIQDGTGIFLNKLKGYDLINNKHIPEEFILNSRQVRLELLAGLLDSDGYLNSRKEVFTITQKRKGLASQIQELAQSLGFRATLKEITKKCGNNGVVGTYYKVTITGKINDIPTKLPRKQANSKGLDHTNTNIELTSLGEGDYYGFTLEGPDRLFLLKDGTVTHNTTIALNIMENCARSGKNVLFYSIDMAEDEFFQKSKSKALKISPDDVMDLYFSKDEEALELQAEGDRVTEEMLKNVFINYDSGINPEKIDRDITAFKEAGIDIDLVIIDYLQKLEGCGDFTSPRIGSTLMGLKSLQPKHKVCIVGLSQIPRGTGNEETPVKTAAAAKGGSVYEENASVIINLWRPMKFYSNDEGQQDEYLSAMVAKNRMGECKEVTLKFKGAISEVRDMTKDEKEHYEYLVEERKQKEAAKVTKVDWGR